MTALFELRSAQGLRISIDRDQVRVGRASDNNVVLKDSKVSRYHVNFYITNGNLIVEDAGSQNGFLVNGVLGTGAMILKAGDRLFFGSTEYLVQKLGDMGMSDARVGAPSPTPTSARINIDTSGSLSDVSQNNPRRLILIVAVLAIGGMIYKTEVLDAGQSTNPEIKEIDAAELPLLLDEPSSKFVSKSPTEVTADGKFREGMRDFYNGNFTQAKLSFDEARVIDPSNASAEEYLEKTNLAIESKVTELLKAASVSYSTLQYQRARAEAFEALAIITEEVPSWSRKLASEETSELKDDRKEGQEDILLGFQCDRARPEQKKQCIDALNIIKSCRQKLGVEDSLK
jgi:pSer/pThr/pTyr-binding forkhead associated (FHA) protein